MLIVSFWSELLAGAGVLEPEESLAVGAAGAAGAVPALPQAAVSKAMIKRTMSESLDDVSLRMEFPFRAEMAYGLMPTCIVCATNVLLRLVFAGRSVGLRMKMGRFR